MVTLGQELNSASSISFRLIGRCTFFSSGQSEKTQDSAFFTPPGTCICLHPFGLTRSTNTCDDLDVRSAIPFNDSIETFCSRDCFHIVTRLQKHKMVASCPLFSFSIACHPAAPRRKAGSIRFDASHFPLSGEAGLTLPLAHQRQRNGAQQALFQIPIQPLSAARAWSMSFFSVSACFSSVIAPTMGSPTILPLRSTT